MPNLDSFRLVPNSIKNGEPLTLCIEGLTNPEVYINKKCKIEIFEVDNPLAKSDVIAIFEAKVAEDKSVKPYKYYFTYVKRIDTLLKSIPSPETRTETDKAGTKWTFGFKPKWSLPHFKLMFELSLGTSSEHTIILKESEIDLEQYVFEIGFKIYLESTLRHQYITERSYCTLDARTLLAENCKISTELLMMDHSDMIHQRGIGTQYGSEYKPTSANEQTAFTDAKSTYNLKIGSCIDYVLSACEMGHTKSLLHKDWDFIKSHIVKGRGMSLGEGLEKAGWTGIYFNPDVKNPRDKNYDRHNYTYNPVAIKWRRYQASSDRLYKFSIKELVINYAPTTTYEDGTIESNVTPKETIQLDKLKRVPFGVVNVNGGMHTALFSNGYIYEIHWDKSYKDLLLYEKTLLEEWGWLSGAIQIPQGTWPS